MATALEVKTQFSPPASEHVPATVAQIIALADAVSCIDMYKHSLPSKLPEYVGQARLAVATIWNNVQYPLANPEVHINTEQLDAFSACMKCMQEVIIGHQFDLLSPFIETAYDLITLMAGDKKHLIFDEEEQA